MTARQTGRRYSRWKSASAQLGVSLEEYGSHRWAGELWCAGCRSWRPYEAFRFVAPMAKPSNRCRECEKARHAVFIDRVTTAHLDKA